MACVGGTLALMIYVLGIRDDLIDELQQTLTSQKRRLTVFDNLDRSMKGVEELFEEGRPWEYWVAMLLPPCLYGIIVPVLDFLFGKLAVGFSTYALLYCADLHCCKYLTSFLQVLFTNWENHRTETQYRNHMVSKVSCKPSTMLGSDLKYALLTLPPSWCP